jgi:hypothetical protein
MEVYQLQARNLICEGIGSKTFRGCISAEAVADDVGSWH